MRRSMSTRSGARVRRRAARPRRRRPPRRRPRCRRPPTAARRCRPARWGGRRRRATRIMRPPSVRRCGHGSARSTVPSVVARVRARTAADERERARGCRLTPKPASSSAPRRARRRRPRRSARPRRRARPRRPRADVACACLRTFASASCVHRSSTTSRSRSSASGVRRGPSTRTPVSRSKRSPSRRERIGEARRRPATGASAATSPRASVSASRAICSMSSMSSRRMPRPRRRPLEPVARPLRHHHEAR